MLERSDVGASAPRPQQGRLVVVVPSIMDRTEPWDALVDRLKTLPGYDDATCRWFRTHHGTRWYRRSRAAALGEHLAAEIHQQWVAGNGYEQVVLVGHSFGGVLVRYAYVHALGAFDDGDKREWASAVDRVVLFASLNRGVEVSFRRRWWLPLVAWLARVLPVARGWLVHDLLRASAFITNLRIAWLREISAMASPPLIKQFLGSSDNLVSDEDSRDIDNLPTGSQERVPNATHADLIRLDTARDPDARFALIARAFTAPRSPDVPRMGDPEQRVVIVLHGIRASNDTWPRQLERLIEKDSPGTVVLAATYGRFSARKFMIPATRRRFLGWMQDTYTERLAANPQAVFHFIGHSNGTYLLGKSLENVRAMRFQRILLAGSVLPTTYDWLACVENRQVVALRNDRAARDVPVGVLCAVLRGLFMRDIGTGGVNGFRWEDPIKTEVYYYPGGHGAAVAPENLPRLAAYVMNDSADEPAGLEPEPPGWFALVSRAAPIVAWLAMIGLLIGAVAIVVFGPWSVLVNAVALIGALSVLFVALDLM